MGKSGSILLVGLCLAAGLGGCATTKQASLKSVTRSGFLGDYSKLTPGDQSKRQALLRYINPNARWSQYQKVRIEPVTFWGDDNSKFLPPNQQALTTYFRSALAGC